MNYGEIEPPPRLAGIVRCLWTLTGAAGDASEPTEPSEPVFPDGCPELILNFAAPFYAREPGGALVAQPACMLVGQITRPFEVAPSAAIDLLAVRLEPFAGALFTDDMRPLTDRWCALDGEFVALRDSIATASADERARDVFALIDRRVSRADPELLTVSAAAVRAIVAARGAISVEEAAERVGVSVRKLQRRFGADVGISPKLLSRIVRFQHVFHRWRADPRSIATVAAECGYFDQSHLVRDFRQFAGAGPARALAKQTEFTELFLP